MRTQPLLLALGALALVPLQAQSINIDLGPPGAPPPPDYRAAGIPGFWNKLEALQGTGTHPLYGLDGQPNGVTVSQIGGTEIVSDPLAGPDQPRGPDRTLLRDALVTHTAVENCLFFNGLQNGTYEVTTYAWMPHVPSTKNNVHIDFNPNFVLVGGDWSGVHASGVTYARHLVGVTSGFIGPHSGVPSGGNYGIGAALNGIQLRRLTPYPPLFSQPARLAWLVAFNALHYDVIEGDLDVLRASDGDFTQATTGCVTNDFAGTTTAYPPDNLAPGEGRWYLVRGNSPGGPYTYDEPGSSQVGLRDAEIAASGLGCN